MCCLLFFFQGACVTLVGRGRSGRAGERSERRGCVLFCGQACRRGGQRPKSGRNICLRRLEAKHISCPRFSDWSRSFKECSDR